jgi:phage shock protein PspC (stress-responsive transcriptional regulator)
LPGNLIDMETTANISSIKRLERPASGRVLAGVCAGLGRYFNLSPAFYRLGFVVLTLLGGAGILVYVAAALVIPEEGKNQSVVAEALAGRRERPWPMIGIALVGAALAVLLARATIWPVAGVGWVLVLLIGLGVLWASRGTPRGRRILLAGLVSTVSMLALAFAAVAVAFSWFDVSLSDGVGSRVYQPANAASLRPAYEVGVGELKLDLTNIGAVSQITHVRAKVGVGELRIIVPPRLPVTVNGHAKVGDLAILDRDHGGQDVTLSTGDHALLVIDASVGAGQVRVTRNAG